MISIFKSHSLLELGLRFAEIAADTKGKDPFIPAQVIVPNLETSRWLKLLLAEHSGFSGNLDLMLPAEWQWRQIRFLYPELPGLLPSDPVPMSWSLFSILNDEKLTASLPALQSYLRRQTGDSSERAAWQLARQISAVFDQYLVYRPDLVAGWQKNSGGKEDDKWQGELWNILDKKWKKLPDNLLTKPKSQLYHEILKEISAGNVTTERPLYIFNPGLIPVPVLKLLKETGRYSDLYFFMVQPAAGMASPEFITENEILESFGNEALDIHQVFQKVVQQEPVQIQNKPLTEFNNLNRVKKSITDNKKLPELSATDDSINIHSCHSELREVETLHNFLLRCFRDNPEISPDDVLVAMPDPDHYIPFIEAVFGTKEPGLPHIPYHISGKYSAESGLQRAFEHLLSLPDSRFTFSEVMEFVQLPVVLKNSGLPESSAEMLKQWFSDNHVMWGLDAAHRKEENQPEENLQTWGEALRRGWMGQLTGGKPGEMNNGMLPYRGIRGGDQQQVWAVFSGLMRKLESNRIECGKPKTCGEWMDLFENWVSVFLSGMETDGEVIKITGAFEKIRKEAQISGHTGAVSFSMIRSVLLETLDSAGAGSAMFTRGVVFSSMVPVRSIPFKVIALLGLNDDVFPRKPVHPDFDLMAQNPRKGERNRKNEDRNLFLESVLAAEKIHYCSYIGKSQKDDEPIPPSPILSEWIDSIAGASGKKAEEVISEERLFGFSPAYFTGDFPSWSGLYLEAAKSVGKEDRRGFSVENALPEPEEKRSLDVERLVRFFGNPVKGILTERMGVRLKQKDEELDEFILDGLETHILFRQVFGWLLEGRDEEQIRILLTESGVLPFGWPGVRKLHEIILWVRRAFSGIEEKGYKPEMHSRDISIYLQENNLEGTIKSYSKELFLDINPSRLSGKVLFESWIRHLCLSVQYPDAGDTIQLCNLKKGKIRWHRFYKAENPAELLEDLMAAYQNGLQKPLMFFPKTAYEYMKKLPDEDAAAAVAGKEWEKLNYQTKEEIGERSDPYISLLMGAEAQPGFSEWKDIFRRFMGPMTDQMEEIK